MKLTVLTRLEKWPELLQAVAKARTINFGKESMSLDYYAARAYGGLGRNEEALAAYAQELAKDPMNYYVAVHRAYLLQKLERWSEALPIMISPSAFNRTTRMR